MYIKIIEYLTKDNIYKFLVLLVILVALFFTFKKNSFIIINTDKKVKLEIYDICLDSLEIDSLSESAFVPKVPKYLVIHTTASIKDQSKEDLWKVFRERWGKHTRPGYHYTINTKGEIYVFREIDSSPYIEYNELVNGSKGYNSISIHISLTAVSKETSWKDLPIAQKKTLLTLLHRFKHQFPSIELLGHRDLKGVHKACPFFDVKKHLSYMNKI